jgi:hypothetical protein
VEQLLVDAYLALEVTVAHVAVLDFSLMATRKFVEAVLVIFTGAKQFTALRFRFPRQFLGNTSPTPKTTSI